MPGGIGYTVLRTPLGALLVAGTKRGLCLVRFGRSRAELERAVRREYPRARLLAEAPWIRPWSRALLEHLGGVRPSGLLPVDVRGTDFQHRVWRFLRRIPPGSTVTYGDVARSLGRPGAVRAVARACAANPVAIAIPCHRVVRSDGTLGGYRWGAHRKEQILMKEKDSASGRFDSFPRPPVA